MPRKRHATRGVRRHRRLSAVLAALGAALLGVAAILVGHVAGFYVRSRVVGSALAARERAAIATFRMRADPLAPDFPSGHVGGSAVIPSCPAPSPAAGAPAALLEIPPIGLTAPVLQGDTGSVLAVAVGHVPASSWQAGPGTVVLDAHDVTWFHHLPSLRRGDPISVVDPCETVRYRVVSARVERAGTAVADQPGRLLLVTCFPLDALFFTDQRYVLTAAQVSVSPTTQYAASSASPSPSAGSAVAQDPEAPASGVPAPWAGIATLASNPTPLGTLHVEGSPAPSWSQSPAPLNAAGAAQSAFFASLRQAERSSATWSEAHPGLPAGPAVIDLAGQQVVGNAAAMETTLDTVGSAVVSATVTDGVVLSDGATLELVATLSVSRGAFHLVSWNDV